MAIGPQNTVGAIYVVHKLGIGSQHMVGLYYNMQHKRIGNSHPRSMENTVVYIHTDGTDEQNTLILMVDMRVKKCGSNPEFITQCKVH